jgi:hypothetical protein
MDITEVYRELGCSNRLYGFNRCFRRVEPESIIRSKRQLGDTMHEERIDTPVGTLVRTLRIIPETGQSFPMKWWIDEPDDLRVATWLESNTGWRFDQEAYDRTMEDWRGFGLPMMFMPRVNIQSLYHDWMGVENAIYAIQDDPARVEEFFEALDDNHDRMIGLIVDTPIEAVCFGDNVHCGTLPPALFRKYVQPAYLRRNERLHAAGRFTLAHWDGDTKALLPLVNDCGLDGIEAVTPEPQGDITICELRDAMDRNLFLFDGIASILFNPEFPVADLVRQVEELIAKFAPRLVLGISDELSYTADIERVRLVGEMVDDYNAAIPNVAEVGE